MANLGLKTFLFGELKENGEYGKKKKLAGAIEAKVSIETNTVSLYADDALEFEDNEFKKATITLSIDDDDDEIFAELLGHKIEEKQLDGGTDYKEVTKKKEDVAKEVGFGFITTKRGCYKVNFLRRVVFKDFETDTKTKGDSIEVITPTVEGTAMTDTNGVWKNQATFKNESDAIEYLESFFEKDE